MARATLMARAPVLFVDARNVRPGATGVGTYTAELLVALDAELAARGGRLIALRLAGAAGAHGAWERLRHTEVLSTDVDYQSHPAGDVYLHTALPRWAEQHGATALVSPGFLAPLFASRGAARVPRVVFVHDLFAFDPAVGMPWGFRQYLRAMTSGALARCELVATSSSVTRRALAARSGMRVAFAPPGVSASLVAIGESRVAGAAAARGDVLPDGTVRRGPVAVYTASFEPRKNHEVLLEALAGTGVDVVFIHGGAWTRGALPAGVRTVAPRNLADLHAWTAAADVALFPSRTEGFGIPMLEALACGTPLVAADMDAARWISGGGRAARLVAVDDAAAWRQAVLGVVEGSDLGVTARVAAGVRRARGFTWQRAAQRLIAAVERIGR